MAEFEGWGPAVSRRLRSGSPASEIIKVAEELPADLIVVAAGARGLTSTILIGSTAQNPRGQRAFGGDGALICPAPGPQPGPGAGVRQTWPS